MSWQTVLNEKSRSKKSFVDTSDDHNVDQDGNDSIQDADTDDDTTTSMLLSEETALHTIRLSYQLSMELLSKSILLHDDYWCLALEKLEYTSSLALSYINQLFHASSCCCYELQELSYLSRRNLLDCLIKDINNDKKNDNNSNDSHGHDDDDDNNDNYCRHNDRVVRLSSCYKQCINLVNTMIDMDKYDNILLLKTSELALDMNDIWTYKQLILFTNYNRSHLYSDKVLLRYQDVIHNHHKLKRMLSSDDDRHHQYHHFHLNNYNYEYNCNNSDHKDTTDNKNDTNDHYINLSNLITRIEAMRLVTSQDNNKFLFSFIHQLISHNDISYEWILNEDFYGNNDNHHHHHHHHFHHSEKGMLTNNNHSIQTGGCDDKDIIDNPNTDSNDDICIGVGRINSKASSSSSSSIAPSINKRSLRKRDRDDDNDKDDIAATTFTTTTTTSSSSSSAAAAVSSSSAASSTSSKKAVSYSNYSDADDDSDGMNELRVSSNRR
jgi:hypothetical protein